MSTLNLQYDQCPENKFIFKLYLYRNQVIKIFREFSNTTIGIILGVALIFGIIILSPIIIPLFIYALYVPVFKFKRLVNKQVKQEINKNNYKEHYKLYLKNKEVLQKLERDGKLHIPKKTKKYWFLYPIKSQLQKFYDSLKKLNKHYSDNLFQKLEDTNIPQEDADFLFNQLNDLDHDWNDDERWESFQIAHNQFN